jgi:hypothetical protein
MLDIDGLRDDLSGRIRPQDLIAKVHAALPALEAVAFEPTHALIARLQDIQRSEDALLAARKNAMRALHVLETHLMPQPGDAA